MGSRWDPASMAEVGSRCAWQVGGSSAEVGIHAVRSTPQARIPSPSAQTAHCSYGSRQSGAQGMPTATQRVLFCCFANVRPRIGIAQ